VVRKMRDSLKNSLVNSEDRAIVKNTDSVISEKKIYFLVNSRTTSAAEIILQTAKQSSRCIIAGQKTAGLIDYGIVNSNYDLPCPFIKLAYPTSRSNTNDFPAHKPNAGIVPDLLLNISIDKWADFIVQHFIVK
ncbi:MAG TPA: S41 family peptidase, partial [Chitinophagaceae bacterium]|nr:S41 family peptidase [Chitinophagaceae bacterium]